MARGHAREVERGLYHSRWELVSCGGCEAPVGHHFIARSDWTLRKRERKFSLMATQLVACRKCEACMKSRSYMWAARARDEFDRSAVTWMVTFTMSPSEHALMDARIASRTGNRCSQPTDVLRERTGEFGREVTSWIKRVRKSVFDRTGQTGAMRYLLVAEVHDSEKTDDWMRGRPHFHMLLHEAEVGAVIPVDDYYPVSEVVNGELRSRIYLKDDANVRKQWTFGFTKFERCVDSKTAFYLCKYMSKAMMWRVRSSIRYGREVDVNYASGSETRESGAEQQETG